MVGHQTQGVKDPGFSSREHDPEKVEAVLPKKIMIKTKTNALINPVDSTPPLQPARSSRGADFFP